MSNNKTAVVVIHGIGNQRPMDTLREFINNIKDKNDLVFNNPDKIANFHETRRISMAQRNVDFYEYYWANLITEPTSLALCRWVFMLLFRIKSERLNWLLVIVITILTLIAFTTIYYTLTAFDFPSFCPKLSNLYHDCFKEINPILLFHEKIVIGNEIVGIIYSAIKHLVIFIVVTIVGLFTYLKLIGNNVLSVLGDAFKYLAPVPQNINDRYKIRENGIRFLRKLHDLRDSDGNPLYDRIIIVGHSLGSVIGYDLIRYLWPNYVRSHLFAPIDSNQAGIYSELYKKFTENPPSLNIEPSEFQPYQSLLFKELKNKGNKCRITNFVTLGSPLYLIPFLYTENKMSFNERVKLRELITCPPQIQRIKPFVNNSPINDERFPISFLENNREFINHSSPFAFIQWDNFYFKNDFIGGDLIDLGKGISNNVVPIGVKGKFILKFFPCKTHCKYWDKEI